MVYIPSELVDLVIYHSVEVNARSHMKERVLPELLEIHANYMSLRCDSCRDEGVICVECAHDYGYATGPGHYCGQKYIVTEMLNTDQLPFYMDNLSAWANGIDLDIYMGGEVEGDIYSLELQYQRDKYIKGTMGNMMFCGRLYMIGDYVMSHMIEMYYCISPKSFEIDSVNIKSFCRAKGIAEIEIVLRFWFTCMYDLSRGIHREPYRSLPMT